MERDERRARLPFAELPARSRQDLAFGKDRHDPPFTEGSKRSPGRGEVLSISLDGDAADQQAEGMEEPEIKILLRDHEPEHAPPGRRLEQQVVDATRMIAD